jgi:hypothetical protein
MWTESTSSRELTQNVRQKHTLSVVAGQNIKIHDGWMLTAQTTINIKILAIVTQHSTKLSLISGQQINQ